jgi:hypothetical protein
MLTGIYIGYANEDIMLGKSEAASKARGWSLRALRRGEKKRPILPEPIWHPSLFKIDHFSN